MKSEIIESPLETFPHVTATFPFQNCKTFFLVENDAPSGSSSAIIR